MAPSGAISTVFTVIFALMHYYGTKINVVSGYSETYWQSPLQLFNYQSYRSVRVLEYTIPPQTSLVTWVFHGLPSAEGCEVRNVEIAVQHGSYPVITPLGESFPPHFNLHRTELHVIQMSTNGTKVYFQLPNPLPGSWFAAMYLINDNDNRIKQKGFGKNCQYFLGSVQEVSVTENIPELVLRVHIPLQASSRTTDLYRFHTTEQTWEYSLAVSNCRFSPKFDNSTSDNTQSLDEGCPVYLAVHGPALADWDQSDARVNCSDILSSGDDNCTLVVNSPQANSWQYLWVTSGAAGSVDFTVYITVKECQRYGSESQDQSSQPVDEPDLDPVDTTATANNTSPSNSSFLPSNSSSSQASSNPPTVKKMIIPFPMPVGDVSDNTISVFNTSTTANKLLPTFPSSNISIQQNDSTVLHFTPSNQSSIGTPLTSNQTGEEEIEGFKQCTRIPELGRYVRLAFDVQYSLRIGSLPFPNQLLIPSDEPLVLAFKIKGLQDNGGTLKYQLGLIMEKINTMTRLEVYTCIQSGRIPLNDRGVACQPDNQVNVRTDGAHARDLYFPYPEAGTWYITLLTRCFINKTHSMPCRRNEHAVISFSLSITACVDGGCGLYGQCREYFSGVLHFSGCACAANWRGYGCTDGSVAESDTLQLISTLLLSLSNIAFLPAIILALIRRFYVEALVYTYTMFFSTFYHACDGDSRHTWCMMPYNVLAHCDFFGAILSFWVTLVSMAKFPERVRSFLLVLAALALAVGVQWDRHSLWTFLVPAGTGLIIMLISWSFRCHKRKNCYPSTKRWLLFIVPGAVIAIAGLITFAFFETDRNYKYTHSVWHACMALCIVFILPPRTVHKSDEQMHVTGEDATESETRPNFCCCHGDGGNNALIQLVNHQSQIVESSDIYMSQYSNPGYVTDSGAQALPATAQKYIA